MAAYECRIEAWATGKALYEAVLANGGWGEISYSEDGSNGRGHTCFTLNAGSADKALDALEKIAQAVAPVDYIVSVQRYGGS